MDALQLLSSDTRRTLLQVMKRQGTLSLDDAEAATGLARTTLREHLLHLEQQGLVRRFTKKEGRGRPSLRFEITEAGQCLFPSQDGLLLRGLLDFLQRQGHEALIEQFFEAFWQDRIREARRRLQEADPDDLAKGLEVLADLLREEGFMPEIKVEGHALVIRECNCPFPDTVKQTRLPCQFEAAFFEALFDHRITRVSHIPDGHSACTYEFPAEDVRATLASFSKDA